jgi:Undecaprenyl-phosphate glucose phosphotransferase
VLRESQIDLGSPVWRRPYTFSASVAVGSLVLIDAIVIGGCGFATYAGIVGWRPGGLDYYVPAITFIALANFMLSRFGGIYTLSGLMRPVAYFDRMIVAVATSFLFLFATLFSVQISDYFSRIWTIVFAASTVMILLGYRLLLLKVFNVLSDRHLMRRNVAVVGTGPQAQALISQVIPRAPYFAKFVGVFDLARPTGARRHIQGLPVVGDLRDLNRGVRQNQIDDVIIALPWSDDEAVVELVEKLRELPVSIYLAADLVGFRLDLGQVPGFGDQAMNLFSNSPVLEISRKPLSGWGIVAKTIEDYVLGSILLVLLLPVFALVAAAVKLDSPGPVFYRQKRLGFNNEEFDIYKFRSMRVDAGRFDTTVQATRGDPRVTRVGRFIRKTSIDELPQILNVLNGTMSLVGPRPHAVDHNEQYSSKIRGYFARHRVRPGITGWAQVNGLRGETPQLSQMEARVRYDVYYTENWSILLDLRILLWTAASVLVGRNAY